jgi:hypothetical protein
MVQNTQISKGQNTAYKQNKGQRSQDHLSNVETAFDKIQLPFMIKALKKLEIEGMYFNIIKPVLY